MSLRERELYRFGEFEVRPAERSVWRAGEKIALAPKTFEVLVCLVTRAGRLVPKDEIFKEVWPDSFVEESNLTQHVFWIRKALAERADSVVTVPGRGYQFTAPVAVVYPDAPEELRKVEPAAPELLRADPEESVAAMPVRARVERFRTRLVIEDLLLGKGKPKRAFLPAAVGAVLVLAAAGGLVWKSHPFSRRAAFTGDRHEIVLADFENLTRETVFDRTLKSLLAIDLEQSPSLVAASDSDTENTLKLMNRASDSPLTMPVALEVCQRLNDQAVLSGIIASIGHKYLITLKATNCQTGRQIAESKATASDADHVIASVDSATADLRSRLGDSLPPEVPAGQQLPRAHTFSLEALRAYALGEASTKANSLDDNVSYYQRAIELDPNFAAAYLGLAERQCFLKERRLCRENAEKAYQLRDQADELLRFRITLFYNSVVTGDEHELERNLLAWTKMFPSQSEPWRKLAEVQDDLTEEQAAVDSARKALALDPNSPRSYVTLCHMLRNHNRIEEAKSVCRAGILRFPDSTGCHAYLHSIAVLEGDTATMNQVLEWTKTGGTDEDYLVFTLLRQGKAKEAFARWKVQTGRSRQRGLVENADRMDRVMLRREADYGMDRELRAQLNAMDKTLYPQNIVFAYAELGETAEAQRELRLYLDSVFNPQPDGTTLAHNTEQVEVWVPQDKAAVALAMHRPEEAIADLEPFRPLDLTSLEGILLRGRAYLAAGNADAAIVEFQKVIDHRYRSPDSCFYILAHLGMARAEAMKRDYAASRREYQTVLEIWKDADPDLPVYVQARQEFARLPPQL